MTAILLNVKISSKAGIQTYVMQYEGFTVPIVNDEGEFKAPPGSSNYLKWWMLGEPGGSMKVEVFQGDRVIAKRLKSTIPNTKPAGYDRMIIKPEQLP